ncbi:MAG: HlyC/CorC family transporter [Gemmatimonadetes bacterium]|nr:HlyC/CorC family transporter [Gemmatimonadota bacterium]
MDILVPFLVCAGLILLNGMFVAAEFAIIGAPRATIERRAAQGQATARIVQAILHDPRRQDRYIATAQLGITFASLGLGMYGEHTLAAWLADRLTLLGLTGTTGWFTAHALASVLAVAVFTYFHIVVGEMVPKALALMHAEGTVLAVTRPMLVVKALLYPLVVGLNDTGNAVLALMGIRREMGTSQYHTAEELEYIVRESQAGGLLRKESGRVLQELFDFSELQASHAMVPRVHVDGIPLGAGPDELKALLLAAPHTRYPVYDGDLDHIQGVVHIKDLLRLLQENRPLAAGDVRPTAYLPETVELDGVIEAMRETRTQLVVVLDEHGGTAGILTIEDLGVEAVGEVEEGPHEIPDIVREEGGSAHVFGTVRLDEVGDVFGLELEHEDVDTVSGLVLALLERPPEVGDVVSWQGLRFQVTQVEGYGVERCLVRPDAPSPPASTEG